MDRKNSESNRTPEPPNVGQAETVFSGIVLCRSLLGKSLMVMSIASVVNWGFTVTSTVVYNSTDLSLTARISYAAV
jgi:hypothetical protein